MDEHLIRKLRSLGTPTCELKFLDGVLHQLYKINNNDYCSNTSPYYLYEVNSAAFPCYQWLPVEGQIMMEKPNDR